MDRLAFSPKLHRDLNYISPPELVLCPICNGLGVLTWDVPITDSRFGDSHPCRCQLEDLLAQLPPYSFGNFRQRLPLRLAYARAQDCAEGRQLWCVLVGPPGVGKSHLAWAIVRRWLERGLMAQYWQVSELLSYFRQGIEDDLNSLEKRTLSVASAGGLVLDDLGHYKRTTWTDDRVATIIDHCYRHRLPLVAIANLPEWAELQREMPWVYSRLMDRAYSGGAVLIPQDSGDYRLTGA